VHHLRGRAVGRLGEEPYVDPQADGCGVHHPCQLPPPMMPMVKPRAVLTRRSVPVTITMTGSPSPTAGARDCTPCRASFVRERRSRRSGGCPSE
jgi:hypothetical protein